MTKFVQLVEMRTSRFDEVQKLSGEWEDSDNPDRVLDWSIVTRDRDDPGSYVLVVHFPSYEEAMRNSEDPRTSEFAARMQELCDEPMTFRNLDVVETEGL